MSFLQSFGRRKSPRNSPKGSSRFTLRENEASPRVVENGVDAQVDIALANQLVQAEIIVIETMNLLIIVCRCVLHSLCVSLVLY